ncbi:uncharacterized protein FOMMEDRAFT_159306 [Fomitiporia mediterranea MF3/22]|uniref:uncharacterized protein n=1 Tax=Fomitiporia mediterranea (strain MF3/22) TaxID=694068 RepID=UPI0004407888|nr:uncharacterized protein FOMMEDRAFT_159306 [Fomitiporia mediterranea MF3/22]EJD00567.1 hypothetical protein FOMMEDRAFT_159306 [Fomitiporia mediterranea MF3/22]
MSESGETTTLSIFYPIQNIYRECEYRHLLKHGHWNCHHCCPCPRLCLREKCTKALALQPLLGCEGTYRRPKENQEHTVVQRPEDLYSTLTKNWGAYELNLFILDASKREAVSASGSLETEVVEELPEESGCIIALVSNSVIHHVPFGSTLQDERASSFLKADSF